MIAILVALSGFWLGTPAKKPVKAPLNVHPEKEFPLVEHRSFAVVIYAYNQSLWVERSLRSVFEQDYDHYRVLFIDDGSTDGTFEKAQQYILDNHQDEKAILIRNESRMGEVACLYRAVDTCLDKEVVLPLQAKDWLSCPFVLQKLNLAYQNPDVWVAVGQGIDYPSYEIKEGSLTSFYAALFKQIQLPDFFKKGRFAAHRDAYWRPIVDLAGGRIRQLKEPLSFLNRVSPVYPAETQEAVAEYPPLSCFPTGRKTCGSADILVFSFDRPLQLYACLESIQRYVTGYDRLTVLYRTSDPSFAAGYEKVKDAFPQIQFVAQSTAEPKRDFKPYVEKIVFGAPAEYILFAVDDIIVKDFVDLKLCMEQMEKTGAYGFYLRFGLHINHCYQSGQPQAIPPHHLLTHNIYAWDIQTGEFDWGFPNSLDMTLFQKKTLKKPFCELKYKTPNSLEFGWAQKYAPEKAIGLFFDHSKLVNIPMNLVGKTGNPTMNYLDTAELLVKFNQGLKIDIEPLYRIENSSPHFDYIPEFILR